MTDGMDGLLARLPSETPAPDLVPRVLQAVAQRRRLQARGRRAALVAAALSLIGLAMMGVSWPALGTLPSVPDGEALLQAAGSFLSAPLQTLAGSAGSALAWETSLAESIEIAFVLGIVLLMTGAVGALMRLVRRPASPNGSSW